MLTDKESISDLQNYKNKEMLLDVIRRNREQSTRTDTDASETVRGAVSNDESNYRTDGVQRGETSSVIYGRNAGNENSQGSIDDITSQFRGFDSTTSGNDSGIDQHYRSNTKRSAWESVKNVGRQYKNIFTKEETHTDVPTRPSSKGKVEGKRLTETEIIRLRPKMVEYILWQSEHLDQFIIATTTGHDSTIEIWGDITVEEAQVIVDYLLTRGRTDVKTAQAVRYASTLIDKMKLGLIIAPRFYQTAMIYIKRGFTIS